MSTTYTPNPANNPASLLIPSDGDAPIKAADVNVPFEGLADKIAYTQANTVPKTGGTFTGAVNLSGGVAVAGSASLRSARVQYRAPQRPADAAIVNADTTISDKYILPPASNHAVILLAATAAETVLLGEQILLACPNLAADGLNWTVKREDGTVIAQLWGASVDVSGDSKILSPWVLCQFETTGWRGIEWGGYVVFGAGW